MEYALAHTPIDTILSHLISISHLILYYLITSYLIVDHYIVVCL